MGDGKHGGHQEGRDCEPRDSPAGPAAAWPPCEQHKTCRHHQEAERSPGVRDPDERTRGRGHDPGFDGARCGHGQHHGDRNQGAGEPEGCEAVRDRGAAHPQEVRATEQPGGRDCQPRPRPQGRQGAQGGNEHDHGGDHDGRHGVDVGHLDGPAAVTEQLGDRGRHRVEALRVGRIGPRRTVGGRAQLVGGHAVPQEHRVHVEVGHVVVAGQQDRQRLTRRRDPPPPAEHRRRREADHRRQHVHPLHDGHDASYDVGAAALGAGPAPQSAAQESDQQTGVVQPGEHREPPEHRQPSEDDRAADGDAQAQRAGDREKHQQQRHQQQRHRTEHVPRRGRIAAARRDDPDGDAAREPAGRPDAGGWSTHDASRGRVLHCRGH